MDTALCIGNDFEANTFESFLRKGQVQRNFITGFNYNNNGRIIPLSHFNHTMAETFHTPSFGDDEFTIPQISPPAAGNISALPFDGSAPVTTSFRDSLADTSFPGERLPESSQVMQPMTQSQGIPPGGGGIPPTMSQPLNSSKYTNTTTLYTEPLSHMTEALATTTGANFSHNAVNPQFPPQNVFIPPITENESFFRQVGGSLSTNAGYSPAPTTTFHMSRALSMYSQEQQMSQFSTISQATLNDQLGMQLGRMQPRGMVAGMEHLGHGISPNSSTKGSPMKESTSDDSDDNTPLAQFVAKKAAEKETKEKKRPAKRKKKKDPNEPQKPVSAYALFFRDTQAAIKGQNPNATFGEVSKIVASMWDSLDVDEKQAYKQRTEVAKKEYLKKLAAYRASLVSKAAVDQVEPEKSPSKQKKVALPLTSMPSALSHAMPRIIAPKPSLAGAMNMTAAPPQSVMHPQYGSGAPIGMNYQPGPADSMMMSAQSQMSVGSNGMSAAICTRTGCNKPAIISPDWDNEYCSNECVVSHCRDVFTAWVASSSANAKMVHTVK